MVTLDGRKSLAQLTGVDWGEAPENVSSVIRERHEFRQTPIKELSIPGLQRLVTLDFQNDSEILIPHCVRRLPVTPPTDVESLSQHLSLLLVVLRNETTGRVFLPDDKRFDWQQHPELVRKVRKMVEKGSALLDEISDEAEQTDDSLEYYRVLLPNTNMRASLFEALAYFERRISNVEPSA
jgi:hypothetical protein